MGFLLLPLHTPRCRDKAFEAVTLHVTLLPGGAHGVTQPNKKVPVLHSKSRAAPKSKVLDTEDDRPSPQRKPPRPREGLPSQTHTWLDTGFKSELNPKFPFGFKAELYQH